MSEKIENETDFSNKISTSDSSRTLMRMVSIPSTPVSPLAKNPWYQQKFEQVNNKKYYFIFFFLLI